MEKDELSCQKKLRNEVIQLEDTLAQVRKEYEMLRNEFEQNMAQNDQTVPINKEITQITKTLMSNNSHLKTELSRHKRKLKEAQCEILKVSASIAAFYQICLSGSQLTRHHIIMQPFKRLLAVAFVLKVLSEVTLSAFQTFRRFKSIRLIGFKSFICQKGDENNRFKSPRLMKRRENQFSTK